MKKTELDKRTLPIDVQEVGVVQYPYDIDKEFEFIKKMDYEPANELKEDGNDKNLDARVRTTVDKFILYRPEFKKLYEFFQDQLDNYVKHILGSEKILKIGSSWVAMMEHGQWTEPHTHISIVNGCFYVNVPDDKTPLILDTYNCLNEREDFTIPIKEKDLVLWDNELSHWVPENTNKETRYALAFSTISESEFEHHITLTNSYNKHYGKK